MEPSTSRDQRNVRPVFQREDIIRMLLNQDDDGSDVDDEPFYENSGSEYEQSEPDSDSCNEESRSRSPTLDLVDLQPPSKKKKVTPRSRSRSKPTIKTCLYLNVSQGKKKGNLGLDLDLNLMVDLWKMIAARTLMSTDADFEIIGASSVSAPRALFDAENDDVAHREVFAAVVNVSE